MSAELRGHSPALSRCHFPSQLHVTLLRVLLLICPSLLSLLHSLPAPISDVMSSFVPHSEKKDSGENCTLPPSLPLTSPPVSSASQQWWGGPPVSGCPTMWAHMAPHSPASCTSPSLLAQPFLLQTRCHDSHSTIWNRTKEIKTKSSYRNSTLAPMTHPTPAPCLRTPCRTLPDPSSHPLCCLSSKWIEAQTFFF